MTKADDVRETPSDLFQAREKKHGPFDLDAAATHANAKARAYYTELDGFWRDRDQPTESWARGDGLTGEWFGRVWVNPPFSQMGAWAAKCWRECAAGRVELIDFLSPATRCEQPWWQKMIEPYRDGRLSVTAGYRLDTEFLAGRQHFLENGGPIYRKNKDGSLWINPKTGEPERSSPKFGCVMLTWRKVVKGP